MPIGEGDREVMFEAYKKMEAEKNMTQSEARKTREGGLGPSVREKLEAILDEILSQEKWLAIGMAGREAAAEAPGSKVSPRERLLQEAERATALVNMLESGDQEGIKRFFERGLRKYAEITAKEIARDLSSRGKKRPPAEARPEA